MSSNNIFISTNHNFDYEIQTVTQIFYPNTKYIKVSENESEGIIIISNYEEDFCYSAFKKNGEIIAEKKEYFENYDLKYIKHKIKKSLYDVLKSVTEFSPPWGAVTGIRPSKRVLEYFELGYSQEKIIQIFKEDFDVTDNKIDLLLKVAEYEKEIIKENKENSFSIYIGIPFCPSKCLYCSFTSFPIEKYKKHLEDYFRALFKELDFIKEYSKDKILESIYIGGGTPTSIDEEYLEKLLKKINENFNIKDLKEFSVEAGRADTITNEKLKIMKNYNVSRISINTQSINDRTLVKIGRNHTSEDFFRAYSSARTLSFDNINVDIILGLPEETILDVKKTIEEIIKLNPENITVHTLSIKRGSELKRQLDEIGYEVLKESILEVENMLNLCKDYMEANKYLPYYMYRQKNTLGNFENIGYCKNGFESFYNIQIMEEKHTIVSAGAGGATKVFYKDENRLERAFNTKSIEEYIAKIDEMILRKKRLLY